MEQCANLEYYYFFHSWIPIGCVTAGTMKTYGEGQGWLRGTLLDCRLALVTSCFIEVLIYAGSWHSLECRLNSISKEETVFWGEFPKCPIYQTALPCRPELISGFNYPLEPVLVMRNQFVYRQTSINMSKKKKKTVCKKRWKTFFPWRWLQSR